jgi:hypothetical protein
MSETGTGSGRLFSPGVLNYRVSRDHNSSIFGRLSRVTWGA